MRGVFAIVGLVTRLCDGVCRHYGVGNKTEGCVCHYGAMNKTMRGVCVIMGLGTRL